MKTVKIYNITCYEAYMMEEKGEWFSLTPWGKDTDIRKGYDDGGKEYYMPDCYDVCESMGGVPMIYNGDTACTLDITKNDTPVIIDYTLPYDDCKVALKKCE